MRPSLGVLRTTGDEAQAHTKRALHAAQDSAALHPECGRGTRGRPSFVVVVVEHRWRPRHEGGGAARARGGDSDEQPPRRPPPGPDPSRPPSEHRVPPGGTRTYTAEASPGRGGRRLNRKTAANRAATLPNEKARPPAEPAPAKPLGKGRHAADPEKRAKSDAQHPGRRSSVPLGSGNAA